MKEMNELRNKVVSCSKCSDCKDLRPVFGSGAVPAEVMFVGLAPSRIGSHRTGIPFTSPRSGRYLRNYVEAFRMADSSYFTNVIKCRAVYDKTSNHIPKGCAEYLNEEVTYVDPDFIVPLGMVATRFFLKDRLIKHLFEVVGKELRVNIGGKERSVFPMYHPSWVLREEDLFEQRDPMIRTMFADLSRLLISRRNSDG